MANNKGQFETIRYVIYDIASKRPQSQGTCQRRDFHLVQQNLPRGQGGDRAKILKSDVPLDLTPYDELFDPNRPTETGLYGHLLGFAESQGKTIDDAIIDIDDLDTENE